MTHQPHEPTSAEAADRTTRHRDLLKAAAGAGGALVVVGASAGTAAAGDTPDEVYSCGCSQVVVTGLSRDADVTILAILADPLGSHSLPVSNRGGTGHGNDRTRSTTALNNAGCENTPGWSNRMYTHRSPRRGGGHPNTGRGAASRRPSRARPATGSRPWSRRHRSPSWCRGSAG